MAMKEYQSELKLIFSQLDVSEQELAIYTTLLKNDNASIRHIATLTGINRGTTYDLLKQLVVKGLLSTKQVGQRDYYAAESPEKILTLLQDKRKDLWQAQQAAKDIVPLLLADTVHSEGRPLVRYYEDDEGVVTILKDVLQTCRVLENPEYVAYSSKPLRQYLYRKFPQFTERRVQEGISVKVIAIGDGGDDAPQSERRWLRESDSNVTSSYMIVYGNKVVHISISEDLTPYGVVIEDASVASMQRTLFMNIWQQL